MADGVVEVKPAGSDEWRPASPLMSLLAGDIVRASNDASAVILLSGGRGTLTVGVEMDTVAIPDTETSESKFGKAQALLAASLRFIFASAREAGHAVITTRTWPRPPVVLAPRGGPVLEDAIVFEWLGARFEKYTVQILGDQGSTVVIQQIVEGARWEYPEVAPRLKPGTEYIFRVIPVTGSSVTQATFEILSAERTREVRDALALLEREALGTLSASTLTIVGAGYLADAGLMHEARRTLLAGLARDPDEATFYLLLGHVYMRTGLGEQANRAFDEARFLTKARVERR